MLLLVKYSNCTWLFDHSACLPSEFVFARRQAVSSQSATVSRYLQTMAVLCNSPAADLLTRAVRLCVWFFLFTRAMCASASQCVRLLRVPLPLRSDMRGFESLCWQKHASRIPRCCLNTCYRRNDKHACVNGRASRPPGSARPNKKVKHVMLWDIRPMSSNTRRSRSLPCRL